MSEKKSPEKVRSKWLNRIKEEKNAHKDFRVDAKNASEEYYGKQKAGARNGQVVPMFWSTVNVTHAALYSRPPRPDVRKRNVDVMDGVDKQIAMMLERGLSFVQDTTDWDSDSHAAVNDFLVAGLGQAKVEMDVKTQDVPIINPITGQPIMGEDGPVTQTVVASRTLRLIHVPWGRYHWEPTTTWRQVSWMAYDHYMGEDAFEEQFGVKIPEDKRLQAGTEKDDSGNRLLADKYEQQYCVHEIWDREHRKVLFICEQFPDIIEERDDPLELEGFFPSPRPMMANCEGEEVIPKPDYIFIRDLLKLINEYSRRIASLTRQVKDVGYYDASFTELDKLRQAEDGTRIPLKNLLDRLNAGGAKATMDSVVAEMDNRPKVEVIANLIDQRDQIKGLLYEAIGISDITRGSSNPNETASAQRIKDQWSNVRLAPRLDKIAKFFRDTYRIMAEIICQSFEPEQITQMTGVEVTPEMQEVMKTDALRAYAVDIETDSTIAQDDSLEREQRNETSQTVSEMLQNLVPAMQAGQLPAGLAKALMLFTVRTTKYGREFEDEINQLPDTMQQLQGLNQQVQQGQQESQQLQQQLQQAQGQLQQVSEIDEQRKNLTTQTDAQLKSAQAQKTMAEAQNAGVDSQAKVAVANANAEKAQIEAAMAMAEAQAKAEDRQRTLMFEAEDRAAKAAPRKRKVRANIGGEMIDLDIDG